MGNSAISSSATKGFQTVQTRPALCLVLGLACYGASLILNIYSTSIISSPFFRQLDFISGRLADHLWSKPSVLALLFISISLIWFSYQRKSQGKKLSCLKAVLLFLFFVYTLFPLSWVQNNFARSLDSFPDQSSVDCIIQLLGIAGTVFCCLYCFTKLPSTIVTGLEKVLSGFFKLKESHFICSVFMLCLLCTGIIAYTVLNHIPHVEDSIAQLFQAKIFKMGQIYASLPPHKEFFDYSNIINDHKWYAQYPPGHSFLLMVGLIFGAPWLIGPLMGTLSLLIFFLLVKKVYNDQRTPYLCCMLMFFSPFFLFMSSNHMSHSSTLFFLLAFLYCYLQLFSSASNVYAIFSGLCLGYAIIIRPLDGVAIATPFMCYALYCAFKKKGITTKQLLCLGSSILFMILLLLLYNKITTGNPFLFGYQKKYGSLGFLGSAQFGPSHTLKGGLINSSNNLIGLNQYLFEWPLPSLIFIFIFFLLPVKKNRWEHLFIYCSLVLIVSYFFYFYQDLCFGPRNFYSLLPFAVLLTVRGFLELPKWLALRGLDKRKTEATLFCLLLLFVFYTISLSIPSLINKYSDDYWWITDKIHKEVTKQGITNAIVFIDVWHPPGINQPNLIPYGSGFQFNSPDLSDDVIYAMDLREKNSALMKAFPQRNYYLCKIHKPMSDFTLIKIDKESPSIEHKP